MRFIAPFLFAAIAACSHSSPAPAPATSTPEAAAAPAEPAADLPQAAATDEARLVPTTDGSAFIGYKVFAIRAGGRFEHAGFQTGDVITAVDSVAVNTDAGRQALDANVINGAAKASVTVTRASQPVTLTVDAK